jgi:hypothetical protein
MNQQRKSGTGLPHSKALRAAEALVVRERDIERLGKEFFPHLIARQARELIETLFGLRGYVLLVIKP